MFQVTNMNIGKTAVMLIDSLIRVQRAPCTYIKGSTCNSVNYNTTCVSNTITRNPITQQ